MVQRLKSWESPRKEGRNKKGKGGSARARQLKKQQQMLRKKLKGEDDGINKNQKDQRGKIKIPSLFLGDRSVLKLGFSTKFGFQKPGFYLIFWFLTDFGQKKPGFFLRVSETWFLFDFLIFG